MQFVRSFSGPGVCEMLPNPRWVEIGESDSTDWHSLSKERFRQLCPVPKATDITQPTFGQRVYRVRRCLLSLDDGDLYDVEEQVPEDGMVTIYQKKRVLEGAAKILGRCSPGEGDRVLRDAATPVPSLP